MLVYVYGLAYQAGRICHVIKTSMLTYAFLLKTETGYSP